MAFTVPEDAVPLRSIMAELEKRAPFEAPSQDVLSDDAGSGSIGGDTPADEQTENPREAYERKNLDRVASALESCDGYLILISDTHGERRVEPDILRVSPPSWAHSGYLLCFDDLNDLKAYDKEPIYLPERFRQQVESVFPAPGRGRPKHPAYDLYAEMGFDRGGQTLNQLQRYFEAELGCPPPSFSTIREWEREGKRRPDSNSDDE